ncbi:unnamed protein product [Cercospora beticola]|nr:unnamed protein product [Cercospora beticola]
MTILKEGTAVYYASYLGLQHVVQALLDTGAAIDDRGGFDKTALLAATFKGHYTIVQMLAKAGADLGAEGFVKDFGQVTALRLAVDLGHEKVVQTLLEAEVRVSAPEEPSIISPTLLQKAVEDGNREIAKMLIEAADDVDPHYFSESLTLASRDGNVGIVRMLINAGAYERHQALETASHHGHREIVQLLLGQGEDVAKTAGLLSNLLIEASYWGATQAVTELIKAGVDVNTERSDGRSALRSACSSLPNRSDARIVRKLLDAGANVNAKGPKGDSALHRACSSSHDEMVQMLLDAGANVNARGRLGTEEDDRRTMNALEIALRCINMAHGVKTVEMLLAAGAVIDIEEPSEGRLDMPLITASAEGSETLVQALIEGGADVNAHMSWRRNALEQAIAHGREEVVRILLAAGANPNERAIDWNDIEGSAWKSAVLLALSTGNEKIVRLLLEAGAEINDQPWSWSDGKKNRYETAIQAELARGNETMVQMLLDAGAEINDRTLEWEDNDGNVYDTALQAEMARGNAKMVQMLLKAGGSTDSRLDDWKDDNGRRYEHALFAAVALGNAARVQRAIDDGADVNHRSPDGTVTPLRIAIAHRSGKKIEILLKAGAKVDVSGVVWKDAKGNVYDDAIGAAKAGSFYGSYISNKLHEARERERGHTGSESIHSDFFERYLTSVPELLLGIR